MIQVASPSFSFGHFKKLIRVYTQPSEDQIFRWNRRLPKTANISNWRASLSRLLTYDSLARRNFPMYSGFYKLCVLLRRLWTTSSFRVDNPRIFWEGYALGLTSKPCLHSCSKTYWKFRAFLRVMTTSKKRSTQSLWPLHWEFGDIGR